MATEIVFGQRTINVQIYDPNTLAARGFAQAAEASATEAAALIADTTAAIGKFVNQNVTVEDGYWVPSTGAPVSNAAYQRWGPLDVTTLQELSITALKNESAAALVSFFDDGGDIVGSPVQPGTGSVTYAQNVRVPVPAGAVTAKGSGWNFDDAAGPKLITVEALTIDAARADDVADQLAGKPFVLQAWDPDEAYYAISGVKISNPSYRTIVREIEPGQQVVVENGTRELSFISSILFGARLNEGTGNFGEVIQRFEDGEDFGELPITPTARTAPPRTTHVAITTKGDRPVRVYISQTVPATVRAMSREANLQNRLRGKTAVVFGTSIETEAGIAGGHWKYIAETLGIDLTNEAISGSCVRKGVRARRTSTDPHGWTDTYWANIFVAMGKSDADCDDLIDNWGSKWRDLVKEVGGNAPTAPLSSEHQTAIRNSSYETILDRHLGDGNRKDFYIFTHGFNDWGVANFSDSPSGTQSFLDDMDTLPETAVFYEPPSLANAASTTTTISVAGAVSGMEISAEFTTERPAGYTISAAVTAPGVVTVTFTNNSGGTVNLDEGLLTVNRLDRSNYIGAMEFMFNRIRQDNPRARILLITHFENQRSGKTVIGQEIVASRALLPICPLYKQLGYSSQQIVGGANDGKTMFSFAAPDGIHPFTDTTGVSRDEMADAIARWLMLVA